MKKENKKAKTKKIALLGGSFNPIHNTHIQIIKHLLNKKIVDDMWLIPCKKHAFNKALASEKHRIKMIKLAIKNIKKARICYIELKSKKVNYTTNTIRKLKAKYHYQFFLVVGSDILYEIKKWQNYKQLLKEIEFIIFKRKGYAIKKIPNLKIARLLSKNADNISSTKIREKAREGKTLKNLVSSSIEAYIKKYKLYR